MGALFTTKTLSINQNAVSCAVTRHLFVIKCLKYFILWDFLSVLYWWNRFPRHLSVRLSVCPSVHSVSVHSVFRNFLSRPLRYWLEIWYMDLSWHNTDQVWLCLRLTYFYMSYCPLLKFRFPDFCLSSFNILSWNFIWICLDIIQVKFDFGHVWPTFTWVIALC